jgi:hypothetical protein
MDTATVLQFRDPASEINREHDLVLTADANRMQHYVRCGELLLAQKAALKHGEFKSWIGDHCRFSYKTAADYMRAAKQKSRGLDFSSLDVMKKTARPERIQKPDLELLEHLDGELDARAMERGYARPDVHGGVARGELQWQRAAHDRLLARRLSAMASSTKL